MKGKVKWFSAEKGYGFLYGDDGQEYHCSVRDVQGAELPRNGDQVEFETEQGRKGLRATQVRILERGEQDAARPDDRDTCAHCGKRMVPRIITHQGRPRKSVCPFCGKKHKDFGPCFIATAVYGNPVAPEVCALRRFRDTHLLPYKWGRGVIVTYYHFSPPIADWLQEHPRVAGYVRMPLNRLARPFMEQGHEETKAKRENSL